MKKLILVIIVFLVIGMGCDAFRKWETFESKEGWFRVLFPGNPELQKLPQYTPLGSVTLHMYFVESGNGAYAACYFDIPGSANTDTESPEFFRNMAQGSFTNIGTGQFTSKEIELDGYPGLEAEGKVNRGKMRGIARFRYYVVDDRVFMLQVIGSKSFVSSSNTGKFFDSFQLLPEE